MNASPRIHILPDQVVNKIAAGEIVERPVAIIKELVENSIDAGATHIKISFSHGGKFSITIEDNGTGMSRDEALLAIKRHATSKLSRVDDLHTLTTFGFRGEALPSIASVSQFRLMTCQPQDTVGTELIINGGNLLDVKDCPKITGTKIFVENLFFNLPARRKFLKSDETETSHIMTAVRSLVLLKPEVSFEVYQNGNEILSSPTSPHLDDRIRHIFNTQEKFILFSHELPKGTLSGAVCDPNQGGACKKSITLFVNGRLVTHKLFNILLIENLQPFFPAHRGILAYCFLQMDPSMVDINVHPTKSEIRFQNELFLRQIIQETCATLFTQNTPAALTPSPTAPVAPIPHVRPPVTPAPSSSARSSTQNQEFQRGPYVRLQHNRPLNTTTPPVSLIPLKPESKEIQSTFFQDPQRDYQWEYLQKISRDIALFRSSTGIIFFNIRLAKMKIIYGRIFSQREQPSSQSLLFPRPLHFEEDDEISSYQEHLRHCGFNITNDENGYQLIGVPEWITEEQLDEVCEIIETMTSEHYLWEDNLQKILLHLSIPNDLTESAILAIKEELMTTDRPTIALSGACIFFEMPMTDILSKFSSHHVIEA